MENLRLHRKVNFNSKLKYFRINPGLLHIMISIESVLNGNFTLMPISLFQEVAEVVGKFLLNLRHLMIFLRFSTFRKTIYVKLSVVQNTEPSHKIKVVMLRFGIFHLMRV